MLFFPHSDCVKIMGLFYISNQVFGDFSSKKYFYIQFCRKKKSLFFKKKCQRMERWRGREPNKKRRKRKCANNAQDRANRNFLQKETSSIPGLFRFFPLLLLLLVPSRLFPNFRFRLPLKDLKQNEIMLALRFEIV